MISNTRFIFFAAYFKYILQLLATPMAHKSTTKTITSPLVLIFTAESLI